MIQVDEWVAHGRHLLEQGDLRCAIAYFDLALDFMPHAPGASGVWWSKALALQDCPPKVYGATAEEMLWWQVQCYEEVLRLDDDADGARFNLANVYRRLNNFANAAELLQRIVDSGRAAMFEPEFSSTAVYNLLATDYMCCGDSVRGLAAVEKAFQAGLESASLREHEIRFKEDLFRDPNVPWSKHFIFDVTGGPMSRINLELSDLWNLGLTREFSALVDDALLQYGPTAVAETAQYMQQLTERFGKSEPVPLPVPPNQHVDTSVDVACELVRTLIEQKKYSESSVVLEQLTSQYPEEASVHSTKGLWHAAQQEYEAAAKCYAQAVALDPSDGFAWRERVVCLAQLGRQAEAREVCRLGIESVPEKDRGLLMMEAALEAEDKPPKALGLLFRLEKWAPGDDVRMLQLRCLLAVGRLVEARQLIDSLKQRLRTGEMAEELAMLEASLESSSH